MTEEHIQLLQSLQTNIDKIKHLYEAEKVKNQELSKELDRQKAEVMYAHKSILELQTKYDNLVMKGLLSINEEERKKAKYRLTKMVREIDKCLALLNQ